MFYIFNVFFISENPQRHGSISDGFTAVENLSARQERQFSASPGGKNKKILVFCEKKEEKGGEKSYILLLNCRELSDAAFRGAFFCTFCTPETSEFPEIPECLRFPRNAGKALSFFEIPEKSGRADK